MTFDTNYSDNPWSVLDKNQREYYDPVLRNTWRERTVFAGMVNYRRNMGEINAKTMHITEMLDPHPDTTALGLRQIWLNSMHVDSRSLELTFQHNGLKMAFHKYDQIVTYWQMDNAAGISRICQGQLGNAVSDMNDLLIRNAMINGAISSGYLEYANGSDFGDIGTSHLFDPSFCKQVRLGMAIRNVPGAVDPSGKAGNSIVCYTSPSVIYDIQGNEGWLDVQEYLQGTPLINYEVGSYKGVRFVSSNKNILWNCGTIAFRAAISAAAVAGDGSPNPGSTKVDGTYRVGQTSEGITHYLQLAVPTSGSMSGLALNDIITVHKTVTDDYGVTDGVDFNEGTVFNARIVGIDADARQIQIDRPLPFDYNSDLGSGVYGYVTKARNINASIFVGAPEGIAAGVAQAPRVYAPPPVDDFLAIQRFTSDQYLGYGSYRPEVYEVFFSAGTTRIKGTTTVQ